MSRVPYANAVGRLMIAEDVFGVVSGWKNQGKSMEMGASVFEKHKYHLQWLHQFSLWLC
jgi:hypothetical protein